VPFLGLDTKEPADVSCLQELNQKEACTSVDKIDCTYTIIVSLGYDGYVNLSGVPVAGVLFIKENKRQVKGAGQSFPCGILRVLSSLDLLVQAV
jgi:hypothetical protein